VSLSLLENAGQMRVSDSLTDARDLLPSPTADPGWLSVEDGIDPAREREIESLFAIGNGYLCMRASLAEGTRFSRASSFLAGLFVADCDKRPRLAVLPIGRISKWRSSKSDCRLRWVAHLYTDDSLISARAFYGRNGASKTPAVASRG